jgi:N-methylhydantoinase A
MRYKGQGWEIPVPLTPAQAKQADPAVFLQRFEQEYTAFFGRIVAGMGVEITVWSVNATTKPVAVEAVPLVTDHPAPTPLGQREVFDAALGRAFKAGLYDRAELPLGASLQGPALITEAETTTVLPRSRQARILGDGSIDITVQGV